MSPRALYAVAALTASCGAGLLFAVQPMIARALLPAFGGTAAVWTTSLLFFQTLLLAGYAYAHRVARLPGRRAAAVHGGLLALSLLTLPITPDPPLAIGEYPALQLLGVLTTSVGAPYVLLAATAPLLQARVAPHSATPYRLYAWSNAGSIAGLLLYPLAVEPAIGVVAQTRGWSWIYAGFCGLMALWVGASRSAAPVPPSGPPPSRRLRLLWVGLSATGVALLMSVTDAIAADLTVTPLFWVVPLLLFLLSFVVAFGPRPGGRRLWMPLGLAGLGALVALQIAGWRASWSVQIGGYCFGLFTGCMALHGELARRAPDPGRLTGFYLHTALGGALGGVSVGLLAPLLFDLHVELPLAIVATFGLCAASIWREKPAQMPVEGPRLLLGALGLALVLLGGWPLIGRLQGDVSLYRSFFGALQVKRYRDGALVNLTDGRISHGFQRMAAERRREPTAYFARHSGVGRLLSAPGGPRRVAVVGLGAGTLAAYARPGDAFDFYEINPDVVDAARRHFTFLADVPAPPRVILGDGRSRLAAHRGAPYHMLILDAFSGDAIPAHLLTREALALYLDRLQPGGWLAINVSNHHADLARVVRAHAAHFDLIWTRIRAKARSPLGPYYSDWMVLGRRVDGPLDRDGADLPPPDPDDLDGPPPVHWTDDFASLRAILK